MSRRSIFCSLFVMCLASAGAAWAVMAPHEATRFDGLVIYEPAARLGVVAEAPDAIPDFADGRAGWAAFREAAGGTWDVHVDRRSGVPLLVQGSGIRLYAPEGPVPTVAQLEGWARDLVARHGATFRIRGSELQLDADATAMIDEDRGVIVFQREVEGVPVDGQRFVLHVVRGNLVSFGTDRWGAIDRVPDAVYGVETTRELLYGYMGLGPRDAVDEIESGTLVLTGAPPVESPEATRWTGPVGRGIAFRLARRFVLRVAGERGLWVGKVDAVTGDVLAFYDDEKHAQVKGGVYPVASDGLCSAGGCERDAFPMPYASMTVNGSPSQTNDAGIFECTGGSAATQLAGPYVLISDACGAVNESIVCDEDLDLGSGPAGQTNCSINPGESAGNTHASRTAFYTVNRIKEKGRYWLPSNAWLANQVQVNVNVNSTCNASWGGQLNMYRAGGGCRNTAETAGVLNHEFAHGLDQYDGGGYDNPSEAYADAAAIISDRASCVGRGFFESQTCSGYGDTCLSCTGIRDMDWDARQTHTPATPENFIGPRCGGGSGACGREVHCEAYPPGEAIYDLAARDLPAAGLDPISAWQLTEKLFYKSRQGSTGNVYNCALPNSDGCNANGWYNTMRTIDDDDGNLSNGTPHAAAIFAAFNRHAIACGGAADNSNKSTSSCPSIQKPVVTAANGSGSVTLSWAAVPNAQSYLILRTEVSCDFTQNVIASVNAPATSYVDTDLPNGFTFYYRIQAVGANTACESAVSSCVQGTPQPFAGTIKLNQATYGCSAPIQITVIDANIGTPTTTATIWSSIEPVPETVVLTETAPSSAKYVGTIQATGGASPHGDGLLAIQNGASITARYIDANDGEGGVNLTRETGALGDCVVPVISQVRTSGISDVVATVLWSTDEASTSVVRWGEVKPPTSTTSKSGLAAAHSVQLTGLRPCTIYWYAVESQDAAGNLVVDDNGGQYHYFETLGNLGNGLQACHSGVVSVDKTVAACGDLLPLSLTDLDLNLSPTVVNTTSVTVTSSTETVSEVVVLTETGPNTSRFTGSIQLATGAPVAGDGILQVADGNIITATYRDADDGTGSAHVSFDSADADCAPPGANLIRVLQITDESAQVEITTAETTTVRVDWGTTAALGKTVTDTVLRTTHTLTLSPIAECGRFYFRVTATDAYGNTRVYDASGAPFEANVQRIPPGIFTDTFETNTGWTLPGEWQIGSPQGKGTAPADPAAAFEGTKVLGHDLTGLGSAPGDFEPGTTQTSTSPVINASTLQGGQLRFRRWLNVGGGASATIEVKRAGQVFTVWSASNVADTSWTLQTVNIANLADGNPSLQVFFRLNASSATASRSSWNIDRFIVNSASSGAYESCGGCGGAPTFEGAASAADADPCGDSGIRLSWRSAPAWGTGTSGTYAVYRDASPTFTPSAANRIAAGINATSYVDATAPNGVTLYYVVRAENNETCSTGPANGGVTESNTVRVSSRDELTQGAAGSLGGTLRADALNEAHVRLDWAPAVNAASFNVYRAVSPQGPFAKIGASTTTYYEDRDQLGNPTTWYYTVRAVNACGIEGP